MLRRANPRWSAFRMTSSAAASLPPLMRTSSSTTARRAFTPYPGNNVDYELNHPVHGENVRKRVQERMIGDVAGGHFNEHKPRAIMFVNKRPVEIIPQEDNLLEVLEREGIRVPKFCYHPTLSVAGNCRMCLVQVEGTQNLIVACSTAALPGMSIITDSRLVRDAREGNVELILVNHPNDCPICEQAFNCDLQHVAMNYGTDLPRYREDKRAVNDFYFDPYTRVTLNRCIHCTRCVRFLNEHTADYSLGMIGRGGLSEISTFMEELEVQTDHAMGAVQLCPVGKLNMSECEENNALAEELEALEEKKKEKEAAATA